MENGFPDYSNYCTDSGFLIPDTAYNNNFNRPSTCQISRPSSQKKCDKVGHTDDLSHSSSLSDNSHKRRNERERYRVRMVNEAYESLRDRLPPPLCSKRMSKVETLRGAIDYIRYLESFLY